VFNRKTVDPKTFSPVANTSKRARHGVSGKGGSVELKLGTEGNQHTVALMPRDHGSRSTMVHADDVSRFGLIYVHIRTQETIDRKSQLTGIRRFLPCLTLELSSTNISAVS